MKSSTAMRIWYAMMGIMLWTGIYLTGFSTIHFLVYLPAFFSVFAAITGFCPSQIMILKLFGSNAKRPAA